MAIDAHLSCVTCGTGTYRYEGSDGDAHTFECVECGERLTQALSPALAAWAKALTDGGKS